MLKHGHQYELLAEVGSVGRLNKHKSRRLFKKHSKDDLIAYFQRVSWHVKKPQTLWGVATPT